MKTMLNKTLLTIVAGLLVLPFAAVALLVGERAMAVAASGNGSWLLVALAIGGVAVGAGKEFKLAHSSSDEGARLRTLAVAKSGAWRGRLKHSGY